MRERLERLAENINQIIQDMRKDMAHEKLGLFEVVGSESVLPSKDESKTSEEKVTTAESQTIAPPKKAEKHRGYRLANNGEDSELSDDEGTFKPDAKPFAQGTFDEVRAMKAKRATSLLGCRRHRQGSKLVFSPRDV